MTLFLKNIRGENKKSKNSSTVVALQSKVSHNMKSLYLSLYSNDKVETVSTVEYVFPVKNQDGSNQSVSHFNFWIQTQTNSPSEVFQGLPAFLVSHKAEKLCLSHKFFFFFSFWKSCALFSHFPSKYIMILGVSCQVSSVCWLTDDPDRFSHAFSYEKSVLNNP